MFLGGAGLADTMLYCRDKIYPLGLPNGVSHVLTAIALLARMLLRASNLAFCRQSRAPLQVSVRREGASTGRFVVLAVTTLEKMLLSERACRNRRRTPEAARDRGAASLAVPSVRRGQPARQARPVRVFAGVHFAEADEISIEGENTNLILDGETFRADIGRPIVLQPAQPLSFVRLAA